MKTKRNEKDNTFILKSQSKDQSDKHTIAIIEVVEENRFYIALNINKLTKPTLIMNNQ